MIQSSPHDEIAVLSEELPAEVEEVAQPRIVPFVLFMAFIAFESVIGWPGSAEHSLLSLWLYPVRTAVVLGSLVYLWSAYSELRNPIIASWREGLVVVVVGVVVYAAWVRMDWSWAMQGQPTGYNPFQAGAGAAVVLAVIRIFGAAIVVPVMEELFWRSFLIRFLVKSPFSSVPLGTFSPLSFGATVILFGLEHHLWLAGMMAGVSYNLLLYYTRRLWPCILAHAITNLILGVHVLITGEWHWW